MRKIFKIGVAGLITYILYNAVFSETENKEVDDKPAEIDEKIESPEKSILPQVIIETEEKTEKKGFFKKPKMINNTEQVLESAKDTLTQAGTVMDNANNAIHNVNALLWKIEREIDNLKKFIFVISVFTITAIIL